MSIRNLTALGGLLLALSLSPVQAKNGDLPERPDIAAFITSVSDRHAIPRPELEALFAQVRLEPKVIEAIKRPYEKKPWFRYRPLFITETRIEQGIEFLQQHRTLLQQAEDRYGVPAEIITAILGVESRYGRYQGSHRVIDSLTTLGFDYPRRGKFFRQELEAFILLSREEQLDPLAIRGSYAGAIGKAQFIPSSYRHYAVDFNGDGVRDLMQSSADAIGSIANYLARHGWQRDAAIAHAIEFEGRDGSRHKSGLKPKQTLAHWRARNFTIDPTLPDTLKAALIPLETESGYEYWLGLKNFYAITRYNHSPLYAMAVYQLSEKIRAGSAEPFSGATAVQAKSHQSPEKS